MTNCRDQIALTVLLNIQYYQDSSQ